MQKINSIQDVFINKTPSLSVMQKEYGKEFMFNYLTIWLLDQNNFAGGKMTEIELKTSAQLIYQDYWFLNLGDLKLIAQRLMSRKFIRVSGNEFYREITEYVNERCEVGVVLNEKNDKDESGIPLNEIKKIAELKTIDKLLGVKSDKQKNREAMEFYYKTKPKEEKKEIKLVIYKGSECKVLRVYNEIWYDLETNKGFKEQYLSVELKEFKII